jgi:methyl-accepting chemotaxis protein
MIESLQQGSKNVVNAMEASKVKSKQSVEQAVEALRSLDEITNSVTTISDMNIQIASAADEQRSVSEEINKNIINISAVVEESAEGAQQTLIASQDLAKLASELQKLVEQFKT